MSLRYTERQNNTPEQVKEYLATALAIVDESDLPPDLVPGVLPVVLGLVATKQVAAEVIAPVLDAAGIIGH